MEIARDTERMRRILRDHEAMELLRQSKSKPWQGVLCTPESDGTWCASAALGHVDAPKEDECCNQVADDPADAIIAALGGQE